ncbi:hypothetical protein Tco_0344728 [Tanacetum coccineum]
MPLECPKNHRVSKSKVINHETSHCFKSEHRALLPQQFHPDVAELKDMVRALILDKKNQLQLCSVKAVRAKLCNLRGGHSYQNCPATDGNINRDNTKNTCHKPAALTKTKGMPVTRTQMDANHNSKPAGFFLP